MATTDAQHTIKDLEAAGADPRLAAAIAQALRTRSGPSPISILAAATALGFAILTASMGWLLLEIHANRGLIEANRDRIDDVNERLASVETGLSERISGLETRVSERLTRIETLLDERLPARSG